MTDDPEQCMELLLKWRGTNYTELALEIDRNPETISRTVKGKTNPQVETAALICFGLHLPPVISQKLMAILGCPLNLLKTEHQWINEALTLKYPEPVDSVREYLRMYNVII
jgi:DNA-binding XRE family transcriptional regulator